MEKPIEDIARTNAKRLLREVGFSPKLISPDVIGLLVAIQLEAHNECIALVNQLVEEKQQLIQSLINGVSHGEWN